MHSLFQPSRLTRVSLASLMVLALTACGGSSSDEEVIETPEEEHEHSHIDSRGRLVIAESGATAVHVFDLDSQSVAQTFAADHAPSAIYSSPNHRYALLFQRNENQVQFVDGGLWQEDHGDHLHDYQTAPQLLGTRWSGARPTHYESHDGYGAIFYDGSTDGTTVSSVSLLSDNAIAAGTPVATLSLPLAMHGTAEPRGEYLLTTYRAPDASGPSQVELYKRDGAGFNFVQRFETTCPGLHGSYSNANYIAFGCTDGVLVVHQQGDSFSARKLANPADLGATARIGTIVGHEELNSFVGIASPGHLFAIDPVAGEIKRIDWAEGRTRRAHAIDADGDNLLVLDDQGKLHILKTADWSKRATLDAVANMPTAAPFPALTASHAEDQVFLSDVTGKQISVIDVETASIKLKYPLNFTPGSLTWLGLPEHEHSH